MMRRTIPMAGAMALSVWALTAPASASQPVASPFVVPAMFALVQTAPDATTTSATPSSASPGTSLGSKLAPIPVLEFPNTEVRSALRLLAEYGNVDIVVDPGVTGTINTTLTNKTWQEAVYILSRMLDLTTTQENGYLYVQKTEDFNKALLDKATAAQTQTNTAQLHRKIIRINNAKAVEMEKAVKDLLSPRGRINVVERTNSLIILDGLEQIASIERIIQQLDLETDQVMIEAKLIQVESNSLQELGINWNLSSGPGVGWATNPSGLANGGTMLTGGPFTGGQIVNATPATAAAQSISFGLLNGQLGVALSHLLSTRKGEVLANPQISTMDNKEAKIFMGDQVPIKSLDESGNTVIKYIDAGTELVVTPQITASDRIMLHLKPQKNGYVYDASAGVVIKKQTAETNVSVTDGETVVIGGLVNNEETKSEVGVPLLKDLPFLGALFRSQRTEIVKKDLVIFVTPHIIRRGMTPGFPPVANTGSSKAAVLTSAPAAPSAPVEAAPAPPASANQAVETPEMPVPVEPVPPPPSEAPAPEAEQPVGP